MYSNKCSNLTFNLIAFRQNLHPEHWTAQVMISHQELWQTRMNYTESSQQLNCRFQSIPAPNTVGVLSKRRGFLPGNFTQTATVCLCIHTPSEHLRALVSRASSVNCSHLIVALALLMLSPPHPSNQQLQILQRALLKPGCLFILSAGSNPSFQSPACDICALFKVLPKYIYIFLNPRTNHTVSCVHRAINK